MKISKVFSLETYYIKSISKKYKIKIQNLILCPIEIKSDKDKLDKRLGKSNNRSNFNFWSFNYYSRYKTFKKNKK